MFLAVFCLVLFVVLFCLFFLCCLVVREVFTTPKARGSLLVTLLCVGAAVVEKDTAHHPFRLGLQFGQFSLVWCSLV